ncbi:putative protein YpbG [bioreactor metagenome]|uniref:Calcineurin-like phosphoesterase domain-containing protein n=1 Tax=bioreactor metagenome TaxID=1076179 RepID=A0A644X254_9ZZZZ
MTKNRSLFRCIGLWITLAAVPLLILFFWTQQNLIQTETVEIRSERLPAAFDGFRIVVISDLHGKVFGENNSVLLKKVANLKPDMIAITGDLIEAGEQFAMVPAVASGLAGIAPTYYVTGNHEWNVRRVTELKKILTQCGVTVLTNEFISLERNGQTLVVAGIDDPNGPADQKTLGELENEVETAFKDPFWVLLAHRNDPSRYDSENGADLVLCGHAHGGLIRLPLIGGLIGTDRQLFPKYTSGVWETQWGTQVFISRGLGNVGRTFRLFNRPQLPLVILRAA